MGIYDDKIGYLAPWLSRDLNQYIRDHPGTSVNMIAKRCGQTSSGFQINFTSGLSPSVKFLAKYALATERDIPSFFAVVGSIINLQANGVQPYGESPEPLVHISTRPIVKKKPEKKIKAYEKARPVVEKWQKENPDGLQKDCVKETGLSRSAVSRHWNKAEKNSKKVR